MAVPVASRRSIACSRPSASACRQLARSAARARDRVRASSNRLLGHFAAALLPAAIGRSGEAEEDEDGSVETDHVLVVEPSAAFAEFRTRDRCQLVHHQAADLAKLVARVGRDGQPEQRRFGRVGRHRADRDRVGGVESVVLHDDHRARLADIAAAGRRSPDFAASHSSSRLIASMNAWSSSACGLLATAKDC